MKALEGLENLVQVFFVKPDPVVFHIDMGCAVIFISMDPDDGPYLRAVVLQGIRDKILTSLV